MERLVCYCLKCKSELARFTNSWDAIGTSYHSPVQPPLSITGLKETGLAYNAAQGFSIENSSLQDVACIECQSTLGLQCYSAPLGHLLKKGQFILNLSLMSVILETTGKKATIVVRKFIALTRKSGKRPAVARRASSTHSLPPAHPKSVPPPFRPPVPLFHANTPKLSAALVTASPQQLDAEKFRPWAENTIRSQQNDIDRVSGTVGRIERDMQSFKEFMEEVRSELALNRETMVQAKDDLNKLRNQAEDTTQRPRSSNGVDVFSKRLDAITDDILLVNQKASKVDLLKEELKKMQDRLASLEEKVTSQDFLDHTATPAQVKVPALPNKRRHDEIASLCTPSSNARSPPKHPSKRTRFSDINVNDIDQNDEPSEEPHLSVTTPHGKAREIISSQQEDSSPPVMNQAANEVPANDQNKDREVILPAAASTAAAPATTKRIRRRMDRISIPEKSMETLNSSPRQLRNSTTANRRKSDINHVIPTLGGKRRKSDGVLVTVDGTTDRRPLRKRQSAAALIGKTITESHEHPITRATRSVDQNGGVNQIMTSVEVNRTSPLAPARPAVPVVFTPALARAFTPMNPTPAPGADDKPFKCGVCEKRFVSFHALSFHHENTSGCEDQANDETPTRKGDKPFKCGTCNKGYTSINALNYHHNHSKICRDTTYDDLPTCPSCGKTYKVLFRLERHIELGACALKGFTSDAESPLLTCNACGKPFKTQRELEGHQCSRTKLHSLNFREASLAAREVALVERERLVRQTLEREMMDVRR